MSCCPQPARAEPAHDIAAATSRRDRVNEWQHAITAVDNSLVLSVPDIHCGVCISAIERGLGALDEVASVRANLTLRQVTLVLRHADDVAVGRVIDALDRLGYPAWPLETANEADRQQQKQSRDLLVGIAVSGFATANIMLLSVSVWSGATDATKQLFHILSLLIAAPAVAFAGRPFFSSAVSALKSGRTNMDVPISLALILAVAMSAARTFSGDGAAYFDAAVMLCFFLLIGRYLDMRMRERARSAVVSLMRLTPRGGYVVTPDGNPEWTAADEIKPGDVLQLSAGERMVVDALVTAGSGTVDRSMVTGESVPVSVAPGDRLEAGCLALDGPFRVTAQARAADSFLSEIAAMMEAASTNRGPVVSLADRLSRLYSPVVHVLAAVTFIFWFATTSDGWTAMDACIAVLIVTCPCALGLAVPIVQVVAAARLFERGILLRNGEALDRLAEVDHVVFDKTGTLTTSAATVDCDALRKREAPVARALAMNSRHPMSVAVDACLTTVSPAQVEDIMEVRGCGMEGWLDGKRVRLGSAAWVSEIAATSPGSDSLTASVTFAVEGQPLRAMAMHESLREGAVATVTDLKNQHLPVEILSGDTRPAVARVAHKLGIETFSAACQPRDKLARLDELKAGGHHTLMVGDGLNDAPALAGAHVSMAPGSACDVGRIAADLVFTRPALSAVYSALSMARLARLRVRQNLGLALAYNVLAVPLAMANQVTPLIAALLMSGSSILVVANALRPEFRLSGLIGRKLVEQPGFLPLNKVREQKP